MQQAAGLSRVLKVDGGLAVVGNQAGLGLQRGLPFGADQMRLQPDMAKCDQNADKAVSVFIEKTKEMWASTKENTDTQKKVLAGIIKSIRGSINQSYESTKKFAAAIPGAMVFSI